MYARMDSTATYEKVDMRVNREARRGGIVAFVSGVFKTIAMRVLRSVILLRGYWTCWRCNP